MTAGSRRAAPGTNLPAPFCGEWHPSASLSCRRPAGHEGEWHRSRRHTWTDDGRTGVDAGGVDHDPPESALSVAAGSQKCQPSTRRRPDFLDNPPDPVTDRAKQAREVIPPAVALRVVFRSAEWDGPPPAAGDVLASESEGEVYVVVGVAYGAGLGHYRIEAYEARLIVWGGSRPAPE